MRSDLDEQDLYPPDAEDTELTAEAKNHRLRAAVGATLLTWGMSLVIELTLGLDLDTFVLGIGIGALAGWSQLRRYNWFAVGSIATGLGAAEVTGAVIGGAFGSTVASLLVAAGFAAIYVRYPRRSMWALVPAAIMALIAAGAFGVGLIGLLPAMLGRFLLPLLLVSGGALLLFRHSLPPKTVKVGLAALAVTFVLVGTTSVPEIDPAVDLHLADGRGDPNEETMSLPALEGRTLVFVGDSGDVSFEPSEDGVAEVVTQQGRFGPTRSVVDIDDRDDDRVVVTSQGRGGPGPGGHETDLVVRLPEGVDVEVERRSGSIGGTIIGGKSTLVTESGAIRVRIEEGGDEGFDDDGPHELRSESGAVRVESEVPLVLDVMTDTGAIRVGEQNIDDDDYESPPGARGIEVEVDTCSGAIRIEGPSIEAPTAPTAPTAPAAPTAPTAPAAGD